jgi:hypothetical protein
VGNRFDHNRFSTLSVNWTARGSGTYGEHQLTNLYVHDNEFQLDQGWIGSPYGLDAITTGSANNRFQANHYIVPSTARSWWMWGPGKLIGWSKWNAFGFDVGGSVSVG